MKLNNECDVLKKNDLVRLDLSDVDGRRKLHKSGLTNSYITLPLILKKD